MNNMCHKVGKSIHCAIRRPHSISWRQDRFSDEDYSYLLSRCSPQFFFIPLTNGSHPLKRI